MRKALPNVEQQARQEASRSTQRPHQAFRLGSLTPCFHQTFVRALLALPSHCKMLSEQLWRLAKSKVDGISTFHKMAESCQVGLGLTCMGGLAQGTFSFQQKAVVATKQDRIR
jgi:hypothetical protein